MLEKLRKKKIEINEIMRVQNECVTKTVQKNRKNEPYVIKMLQ